MNKLKFTIIAVVITGISIVWSLLAPSDESFISGFEAGVIDTKRWQLDKELACEISLDNEIVRDGRSAVRFESGPESRCEILPRVFSGVLGDYKREPYNLERWYAFSVRLSEPWEYSEQNEVIAQWHSTGDKFFAKEKGRGPPLALRIIGRFWYLTYGWDSNLISEPGPKAFHKLWHAPIKLEEWDDWLFHIRWSWADDGLIEVWKNGELLVRHEGPNAYNDIRGNYLKLGSYHPSVNRVLHMDNIYVGSQKPNKDELGSAK